MKNSLIYIMLVLFCTFSTLYGDVLNTFDGMIINGKVIKENNKEIIFSNKYGTFIIRKNNIKKLIKTDSFKEDIKILKRNKQKIDVKDIQQNYEKGEKEKKKLKKRDSIIKNMNKTSIKKITLEIGIPIKSGINATTSTGSWPGFITGLNISSDLQFAKFSSITMGMLIGISYSIEMYWPSSQYYTGDYVFLFSHNIRIKALYSIWITTHWFASAGIEGVITAGGFFQNGSEISNYNLSNMTFTVYALINGGYSFKISNNHYIKLGLYVSLGIGIPNTIPIEIGIDLAWQYRF